MVYPVRTADRFYSLLHAVTEHSLQIESSQNGLLVQKRLVHHDVLLGRQDDAHSALLHVQGSQVWAVGRTSLQNMFVLLCSGKIDAFQLFLSDDRLLVPVELLEILSRLCSRSDVSHDSVNSNFLNTQPFADWAKLYLWDRVSALFVPWWKEI